MTITLADAEMWRHFHRNCWQDGAFRSLEQAQFVVNVHSGHGPSCKQYLSASAYVFGTGTEPNMANDEHLEVHPCSSELELPARAPLMGPPEGHFGAPIETVELFVGPIREWADRG